MNNVLKENAESFGHANVPYQPSAQVYLSRRDMLDEWLDGQGCVLFKSHEASHL